MHAIIPHDGVLGKAKGTPMMTRHNRCTSCHAIEQHGPFGKMDLQAIGAQQLRPDEDLVAWYKGRLRMDGAAVEGEIDKIYVFLNALSPSQRRRYATDKPWLYHRTQRLWQLQVAIKARVDDTLPRLASHQEHDDWYAIVCHGPGDHR